MSYRTLTSALPCFVLRHSSSWRDEPALSPSPSDYLLSNNHINSIIVLKLDFSDEEVLAYYISFLKTLSFKLNKHTIHFFFNEVSSLNCLTTSLSCA